jgi:hypothetical protein
MIVSLEAIFLSTFVMSSQTVPTRNGQVLVDHQWGGALGREATVPVREIERRAGSS